jgi:hypothetical protein
MRKLLRRLRSQRAQGLILFVGLFSVIMAISVIVVDFGLWFSEHRGAQKDADAAALAGAQAYVADLGDTNTAFSDARDWAIKNGIQSSDINRSFTPNCPDGKSCIQAQIGNCREDGSDTSMPWVEARVRHNSRALFGGIFGLVAPDIGAIARACVGSPRTAIDLSPFGVQTGFQTDPTCPNYDNPLSDCMEPDPDHAGQTRPVYGSVCILKTGAQSDDCAGFFGGQRGQLTIGALDCDQTSANTMKHDFHYGAGAACSVDQEVNTGTGNILGLLTGLNDRLNEEKLCDQRFGSVHNKYDDFDEVFSLVGATPGQPIVPSPYNVFSLNQCSITNECSEKPPHTHTYTPRVLDLVLVDRFNKPGGGPATATITGFAGFYVIGCVNDSQAAATKAAIEADITKVDSFLNRCDKPGSKDDILGIFVEKLAPPINVGDPAANLPLSIVLVK